MRQMRSFVCLNLKSRKSDLYNDAGDAEKTSVHKWKIKGSYTVNKNVVSKHWSA